MEILTRTSEDESYLYLLFYKICLSLFKYWLPQLGKLGRIYVELLSFLMK